MPVNEKALPRFAFGANWTRFLESLNDAKIATAENSLKSWLNVSTLDGKTFLDIGSGSGLFSLAARRLGATVRSFDFDPNSVKCAVWLREQYFKEDPRWIIEQGSVLDEAFMRSLGTFDVVYAWGVLHHTPDTKAAFGRVVPLIRKGGCGYIMVYEKHNPVKFACTDLLRRILRNFSEEDRYRFCRHLIIKNPILHLLLTHLIISDSGYKITDPLAISTKQLGLYDAYAPVFNHLHTREEVISWFAENHFTHITLTSPVQYTRPLDVFRWGVCGGAVSVRGVRA